MKTTLVLLGLFLVLQGCGNQVEHEDEMLGEDLPLSQNPFSQFGQFPSLGSDPTQGNREQVFGFYSNGSLKKADALPWEGKGFVKLFRPRNREYSSFDLNYILQLAAIRLQEQFPSTDRIQVGDMSAMNGKQISGHSSHQNGLDVDLAFLRKDRTEQDPNYTGGFQQKFVRDGKLTDNFDLERNWALAKALMETGRVQRIFVNEVVKKGLCSFAKEIGEYDSHKELLRRVRSYKGHDEHLHVRITCPRASSKCKAQAEVPADVGC